MLATNKRETKEFHWLVFLNFLFLGLHTESQDDLGRKGP